MQHRLLRSAERELEHIADYSFDEWGAARAQKTLAAFEALFQQIARFPNVGIKTERSRVYQKSLPHLPFVVLYRIDNELNVVTILQIIHTKQSR